MIKYTNQWKVHIDNRYKENYYLQKEEERMYSNLYIQCKDTLELSEEFLLSRDFQRSKANELVIELDNLICTKVKEFYDYGTQKENFETKAKWLELWNNTTKKQILNSINLSIIMSTVPEQKLGGLRNLVNRYYNYFIVVDSEENLEDKFEEIFDTVVQIPDEVSYYLEVNSYVNNPKFVDGDIYINSPKTIVRKEISYDERLVMIA